MGRLQEAVWLQIQHPIIENIKLMFLPLIFIFYFLRPGVKKNINLIKKKKDEGWQIIIVSANLNNHLNRKMISLWLYWHKVDFDILFLRRVGESNKNFKLVAIQALRPDQILENDTTVINYIILCLKSIGYKPAVEGMVIDLMDFNEYERLQYI